MFDPQAHLPQQLIKIAGVVLIRPDLQGRTHDVIVRINAVGQRHLSTHEQVAVIRREYHLEKPRHVGFIVFVGTFKDVEQVALLQPGLELFECLAADAFDP